MRADPAEAEDHPPLVLSDDAKIAPSKSATRTITAHIIAIIVVISYMAYRGPTVLGPRCRYLIWRRPGPGSERHKTITWAISVAWNGNMAHHAQIGVGHIQSG